MIPDQAPKKNELPSFRKSARGQNTPSVWKSASIETGYQDRESAIIVKSRAGGRGETMGGAVHADCIESGFNVFL